ncbi:MAG: ABC transporter permease subunit [Alphaproteobacteria bacterium]|nr:ABC transporter permease subunit [Alphaproteobacteria bacterium]
MRVVLAIAGRDLRALLHHATGWAVAAGFLLLAGVFWLALLDGYVVHGQEQLYDPYSSVQLSLTNHLLAPYFGNLTVLVLFVAPAVAMRSFADEVRAGTVALLATSPITAWQIVLGKYLGSLGYVLVLVAATLWMPLSLLAWTVPDPGAVVGGYLATVLLAATVVAIGTLVSATTEHPLVALVLTFALTLVLWIVGWVDPDPTSPIGQLSLAVHVQDMIHGALRRSDLSYFALLVGWCLFATWQRVLAWRYA